MSWDRSMLEMVDSVVHRQVMHYKIRVIGGHYFFGSFLYVDSSLRREL